MADQFLAAAGGNWTAATTWESSTGASDDTGPPLGGENTFLQVTSGNCTLDGNSNALGGLFMDGYEQTLAFGANTIDVDGDCDLAGTITASAGAALEVTGYFTKLPGEPDLPAALDIELNGTGFVETNNIGGGTVTVNTAGTHTQLDKALWDAFTLTLGTYRGRSSSPGWGMDVAGDIIRTGGTWMNSGDVQQVAGGTGTYNVSLGDVDTPIEHLLLGSTGVKSTLTGNTYAKSVTIGAGTGSVAVDGAFSLRLRVPGASDTFNQTAASGAVECNTIGAELTSANISIIYLNASETISGIVIYSRSGTRTVTMTGEWDAGSKGLHIMGSAGVAVAKLDCAGQALTCGAITLGASGATDRSGQIDFGEGIIDMASLAVGGDANADTAIAFASAYIKLSGTFNGNQGGTNPPTNTNTKGVVVGGVVTELDLTGETALLHLWPSSGGANLTNVTELSPLLHQILGEVYAT